MVPAQMGDMLKDVLIKLPSVCPLCSLTHTPTHNVSNSLTLLVRGLSMRGLPLSLVCAHLQTETQGLRDHVVLSLDNMMDSLWSERSTGAELLRMER